MIRKVTHRPIAETGMMANYSEALKNDKKLLALAQSANELLETRVLGAFTNEVTADWDREIEHGNPAVSVVISGWSGSASATYTLDDLQRKNVILSRLYLLWDDLLKIR